MKEKRRRRQVHDPCEAKFAVDSFQARDPQPCGLVVLVCIFFVIALQLILIIFSRLLAIAVVGLVVQRQNVLQAHQVGHDALEHLPFSFQGVQAFATTLEQ